MKTKLAIALTTFNLIIMVLISNSKAYSQEESGGEIVIPKFKKAVVMSHMIKVPLSSKQCFDFIMNDFHKFYTETSTGHHYFKIRNGETLKIGSVIDCSEEADNQSIVHKYVVDEIIDSRRISYASQPSFSKVQLKKKVIDGQSNTFVYWSFKELENGESAIRITIVVQMKSAFEKMLICMVGGMKPWKKHCIEEMEGLRKVLIKELQ